MLTLGEIKGVGEATLKKLEELDVKSVFELFSYLPSRYIDLSEPIPAFEAVPSQLTLLEGRVERVSSVSPRGKRAFYVTFSDLRSKNNVHFRATFYNLPYMHDSFEVGQEYRLLAKLSNDPDMLNFVNPQLERKDKLQKLKSGVYTQYPLRGTMGQNAFKNIMYSALDSVKDATYSGPTGVVNSDIAQCFESLHRPDSLDDVLEALTRLASIDLAIALSIYKNVSKCSYLPRKVFYKTSINRILDFKNAIPFSLTQSQEGAMSDILSSLSSDECMARIISGDVGSGKTVVAFFAMYVACASGHQAAMMVPTEILAKQHASAFAPIAEKLGVKFAVLTSSMPTKEREAILQGLQLGEIDCAIGTQSLISKNVAFKDLTLAVIDEQHKFGVAERKMLEEKGAVDVISMTATPIPRSMALTFYDDIDISYIQKRDEATTNVATQIIGDAELGVKMVTEACARGQQAFIVCPAIQDAEGYESASVESFTRDFRSELSKFRYAALHGKLKDEQKEQAMRDFAEGKLDILVATTVVEVGIDTKASEILILNADRFGLASLHQLRGRVGRDGSAAHCYLQSSTTGEKALKRLQTLEKCNDGQRLAEVDFEMRGAGDFIGTRQSGARFTPIFGLRLTSSALAAAKRYSQTTLSGVSLDRLLALTRRGESRVQAFLDSIKKVTLNS